MDHQIAPIGIGAFLALALTLPSSSHAQTCGTPGTGAGQPNFGEAMCGISAASKAAFEAGRLHFLEAEDKTDGLGPVFNGDSCVSCHAAGGVGGETKGTGDRTRVGGASNVVETRFGKLTNGVFDPLASLGGSLIQTNGIGVSKTCNFSGEAVPASANVVGKRLTTPLFGIGLVNLIPDLVLEGLALAQPSGVRGHTARIKNVAGQNAIGKFGWKNQVATVFDFAGDAYLNEMGITTKEFPKDNAPQGNATALASCDLRPDTDPLPEDDDGADVRGFADFMTFLAPPPRVLPLSGDAALGAAIFNTLQCNQCHTPSMVTGPSGPQGLTNRVIFPYSDFLLHNMGSLGDGIPQGNAAASEMRTAPLWGARVRTRFLHTGLATNLKDAIKAHDGQGKTAKDLFNLLPVAQQNQLIAFINTL